MEDITIIDCCGEFPIVQGIAFDYENNVQGYRQKFIRAWGMVNKVDSKTLGHKNFIP